jgi:hypothetical protein
MRTQLTALETNPNAELVGKYEGVPLTSELRRMGLDIGNESSQNTRIFRGRHPLTLF